MVAVVGHVEWMELFEVPHVPRPGEIVAAHDGLATVAGSGAVAAIQLARLAGEATFFTALADDDHGRRAMAALRALGVTVHAGRRPSPQRRALVHVDRTRERTITVFGPRGVPRGDDPLPWSSLADFDAVYFTAGDAAALHASRRARILITTPRAADAISTTAVRVDALVHSADDALEQLDEPWLHDRAMHVVTTTGRTGGRWTAQDGRAGTWTATQPPGPVADTYGCGDSFAGGLTYALASGLSIGDAVRLGADCGAACATGRGPHAAQIDIKRLEAKSDAPRRR
jgi:ribokinase